MTVLSDRYGNTWVQQHFDEYGGKLTRSNGQYMEVVALGEAQ
jgi:hypothetical protein